jgi:hypothetical protein
MKEKTQRRLLLVVGVAVDPQGSCGNDRLIQRLVHSEAAAVLGRCLVAPGALVPPEAWIRTAAMMRWYIDLALPGTWA